MHGHCLVVTANATAVPQYLFYPLLFPAIMVALWFGDLTPAPGVGRNWLVPVSIISGWFRDGWLSDRVSSMPLCNALSPWVWAGPRELLLMNRMRKKWWECSVCDEVARLQRTGFYLANTLSRGWSSLAWRSCLRGAHVSRNLGDLWPKLGRNWTLTTSTEWAGKRTNAPARPQNDLSL